MRIEEDFLGKIEVPKEAYYGIFTVRASSTFKLSGILVRPQIIRSVAIIKKCAAKVNSDLGKLDIDDLPPGFDQSKSQGKHAEFVHRGDSFQSQIRLESYHSASRSLIRLTHTKSKRTAQVKRGEIVKSCVRAGAEHIPLVSV